MMIANILPKRLIFPILDSVDYLFLFIMVQQVFCFGMMEII
jgi:hypothetical protein